jgi:hypothetical protein
VKEAVKKAINEEPVISDPKFAASRKATVGTPLLAKSVEGKEEYWFVPLLSGAKASGYAQVEKNLIVSQLAVFGATPEDRGSWIDASFFEKPPLEVVNSIRARYPGMEMSAPFFSFDTSPSKWGWMVIIKDDRMITIFISPSGWQELKNHKAGFEG